MHICSTSGGGQSGSGKIILFVVSVGDSQHITLKATLQGLKNVTSSYYKESLVTDQYDAESFV